MIPWADFDNRLIQLIQAIDDLRIAVESFR